LAQQTSGSDGILGMTGGFGGGAFFFFELGANFRPEMA
jgi:hypothetical protein